MVSVMQMNIPTAEHISSAKEKYFHEVLPLGSRTKSIEENVGRCGKNFEFSIYNQGKATLYF